VIVVLADGARCFAQSVTVPEADLDLAILRLPEVRAVELAVSDSLPKVGERVFAIGSPMGLTNTLSEGLVSMVHTDEDGKVVIQTSAAISHGSSGGALVDAEGRVLGMTTSGIDGAQNLGFCIPGSRMLPLLGRKSNARDLASPFLGGSGSKENGCELSKRYLDVLAAGWEEKHAEAVSLAKALTASHPDAPMAWYVLGIAQIKPGTIEEVAAALERAVRLAPGNAAFQLQLGYVYFNLGRGDEARAAVGRSHDAMPCDTSAFLLACLAPDDLAAVDRLQESIRLNPAFGLAHRELGCRLIALGQDARAEAALVEACRLLPEDARAHEQLGLVENRLENFAEAVNVLRKAVRLDPNQAEAQFQLGYALAGSGQHAAAIEAYRECLRVMPDCAGAVLNVGLSFGALGCIDESIQALQECVRMQPEDPATHYHLGRAWLAKGDRRGAQAEVETLRKLDPDTARQLLGEIHETK
jgi:tetratricopeptide (TPR) repeat protein